MRLLLPALMIALPLLSACDAKVGKGEKASVTVGDTISVKTDGDAASVAVGGQGLNIDTEGFKASMDIPGMTLGGDGFDISGMKLLPGSQVRGMKVLSRGKDGDKHNSVTITFTSPGSPDAVLTHAAAEAKARDWTVTRTGNTLSGTGAEGKTLAYAVAAAGKGSSGTLTLTDTD